jgi:hypothetical protein
MEEEELDMEKVLGGKVRKEPEPAEAETATVDVAAEGQ